MIWLPRWLDDELHGRGLAFGAVAIMALMLAAWLVWPQLSQPEAPAAAAAAAVPTPAPLLAPLAVAEPVVAAVGVAHEEAPVLPECPHQHLDITGTDGLQRGCVAATRTRQQGSIRSHVLEPEGISAWRLVLDVVGGSEVISARLSRPALGPTPAAFYACDGAACQGIAIGRPDAQGARTIKLEDAALQALPPGQKWRRQVPGAPAAKKKPAAQPPAAVAGGAPLPTVRLTATLRTLPDRQNPALACTIGGVSLIESDGSRTDFCPMGGAGFELADDGRPRFEFRSLEGQSLMVALGADGAIEQVTLGALRCKAPACGGVAMQVKGDASNPAAERSFSFSGTTLAVAGGGKAGATLNGSVTMASQE